MPKNLPGDRLKSDTFVPRLSMYDTLILAFQQEASDMLEKYDYFIGGVGFRLASLRHHVHLTSKNQFDNASIRYKSNCESVSGL